MPGISPEIPHPPDDPPLPPEMAFKAEEGGVAKARLDTLSLLARVAFAGAAFTTVTIAGTTHNFMPDTIGNVIGGNVLFGNVDWSV